MMYVLVSYCYTRAKLSCCTISCYTFYVSTSTGTITIVTLSDLETESQPTCAICILCTKCEHCRSTVYSQKPSHKMQLHYLTISEPVGLK